MGKQYGRKTAMQKMKKPWSHSVVLKPRDCILESAYTASERKYQAYTGYYTQRKTTGQGALRKKENFFPKSFSQIKISRKTNLNVSPHYTLKQ